MERRDADADAGSCITPLLQPWGHSRPAQLSRHQQAGPGVGTLFCKDWIRLRFRRGVHLAAYLPYPDECQRGLERAFSRSWAVVGRVPPTQTLSEVPPTSLRHLMSTGISRVSASDVSLACSFTIFCFVLLSSLKLLISLPLTLVPFALYELTTLSLSRR